MDNDDKNDQPPTPIPITPARSPREDDPKPLDTSQDPVALDDDSLEGENLSAINTGRIVDEARSLAAAQPAPERRFHLPHQRSAIIAIIALLVLIGIGIAVLVTAVKPFSPKPSTTIVVNTQSLNNGTLNRLKSQLGGNGQVKEQLTITPDTLFKNNVGLQGSLQVRKNLDVGGTATVNGDTSLNGNLAVRGSTSLQGAVTTGSSLSVHGSLAVNGNTSITGNLNVGGLLAVSSLSIGSLTTHTITVSNDLTLGGHIVPNGITPTVKLSNAAAGGSVSIDGTDTAGTITITTGNAPANLQIAGEMAIITFHTPFNATPKAQLTPVNPAGAGLQYYIQQSPGFIAVETANKPAPSTTYTFNYFVTQ